jgi:chromosome segregation ATPase
MNQYLKNLLAALLGNNPYEAERDELAEKLAKADEHVHGLNELYYNMLEKWETDRKQLASLQQLVENLRERIKDKDAVIEQLQNDLP